MPWWNVAKVQTSLQFLPLQQSCELKTLFVRAFVLHGLFLFAEKVAPFKNHVHVLTGGTVGIEIQL